MGCDIHLFTEIKPTQYNDHNRWLSVDAWEPNHDVELNPEDYPDLPNTPSMRYQQDYDRAFYRGGRDYSLFGILAGVRNETFETIHEPKGLNSSFSYQTMGAILQYGSDGHTHSYLTLKELKEYAWHKEQTITEVISEATRGYIEDHPEYYPPEHRTFKRAADGGFVHEYKLIPAVECAQFYEETIPKLEALKDKNSFYELGDEDIRIVFFFDN